MMSPIPTGSSAASHESVACGGFSDRIPARSSSSGSTLLNAMVAPGTCTSPAGAASSSRCPARVTAYRTVSGAIVSAGTSVRYVVNTY